MISHRHKFACPRLGKNASSTLVKYFRQLDGSLVDEGHLSVLGSGFHYFLKGGHFAGRNTDEYFKFGFVRNPYDRLVSGFHEFKNPTSFTDIKKDVRKDSNLNLQKCIDNFEDFVEMTMTHEHIHWKIQHSMLHFRGNLLVDYIGHVETIQDDLDYICEKVGLDNSSVTVPVVRKSKGRTHWSEYYTDEIREKVYDKYLIDFESFGYER